MAGRHAGSGRLGGEGLDAIGRSAKHGAAVRAAGDHRRAHDVGGMGNVKLVGHEGAGRDAGNRHLRRIAAKAEAPRNMSGATRACAGRIMARSPEDGRLAIFRARSQV